MMKNTAAAITSNILNPFLVSTVVLVLLALEATDDVMEAVAWILVTIAISILPIFILILFLLRLKKLEGIFNSTRQQRARIYLSAGVLGIVDCVILWFLKVPELLFQTFCAGLVAVVVFTAVNHVWKISLHSAFIAAAVAILIIVFGGTMAWTVVLLPMVAWSRIILKQHSLAQVIVGAFLAAAIVSGVFLIFQVT